jgi:hypothetical protein
MIDWFASKIGILVFLVAALSILMFFGTVQLGLMDNSKSVSSANDLARLSDRLCEGCSIAYSLDRECSVTLDGNTVTVDGVARMALSNMTHSEVTAEDIVLEKEGGYVRAYGA